MIKTDYNPDVLTCLANLSNDEVFTPPRLVNEMLDLLPKEFWSDKNVTFLDPVSKTGVFMREIAKRLMEGLENEIPNVQERVNHIYKNQLYGIAITELTSLLSRRSLYCSKRADGKYSVCEEFDDEKGNILYNRFNHTWVRGNCSYCGASKEVYKRSTELETHAYQFIHTPKPERIFNNMRFDVIVGNPPYQLNDGGGMGTSAKPIYNNFVEQAKKLSPRYLTMIIPARWYSGGKGLDEFRDSMLKDDRIRQIVDFPEAIDCFPGVQIKGGVCYFLWDRDHRGECNVVTSRKGKNVSEMTRPLLEEGADTFIRYNEAISILHKVKSKNEESFIKQVSSRNPFGIEPNVTLRSTPKQGDVKIFRNGGISYADKTMLTRNIKLVDSNKVLISKAGSGSDSFPHQILGKPMVAGSNTACSETYLILGANQDLEICNNICQYVSTRLFRFLVLLKKNTQNAAKGVYSFVPVQDFSEKWTDDKLYRKYSLSENEIEFIESLIRPMDLGDGK